jgi:hypothetical protein
MICALLVGADHASGPSRELRACAIHLFNATPNAPIPFASYVERRKGETSRDTWQATIDTYGMRSVFLGALAGRNKWRSNSRPGSLASPWSLCF